MPDIKLDWNRIGTDLVALAGNIFPKRAQKLATDGKAFLKLIEQRAIKYHLQFAAGRIKKDELDDLMLDLKALIKLEKYKQVGLTQVAIDQFVNGAINILLDAAIAAIP